jgi:tetratricopeptide (TPR) repeat protein
MAFSRNHKSRIAQLSSAAVALAACLLLCACSTPPERSTPSYQSGVRNPAEDSLRDQAMQHFIDASVLEMRGDFAQAALEYQEALRYDKNATIFFALSRAYGELGKNQPAIEAGREAVQRDPRNTEYRRNLASVFLAASQPDSAILQYETIITIDSTSMESWFNLAKLYQIRSPLKALSSLDHITERFGPHWEVLLQCADLCNKLGKFDRAATALRGMVQLDPGNRELRRSLAQTYSRASMFDSSLSVYATLVEPGAEPLDVLAEVAGVHLLKKDYAHANSEFDRILGVDSLDIEAQLHVGELYYGQAEKDSTLLPRTQKIFEGIRKTHPRDHRPYMFLGVLALMAKNDTAAIENFRRVTELANRDPDGWVYLSSVYQTRNNFTEVARILEAALRVLPDDFRVNFFLGVAYNRLSRNLEAVRTLEHARSINPKDVDGIAQLAIVYEALNRPSESDSLYEEALRLDPDNNLVLNNYAYSLAERNIQLGRALTMSQKALRAQPDNGSYLDTIGWIYCQLGELAEAAKYVRQAISKGEANAVVYEHLGDIYFKMNDRSAALEQWQAALKLDSENRTLQEKIARGLR